MSSKFGFGEMIKKLRQNPKSIVFTEGTDARILSAAAKLLAEELMGVILVGNVDEVKKAAANGNFNIDKAEIIDPETGEVLPEGQVGELVFTSLDKEAFPLLRYRTRDLCVLSREKCSCGRTHVRMSKPMGRSDDMLIIRGVNVFPSQIETVLLGKGYAPNYQIEIDRKNNTDTLDVYVESLSNDMSDKEAREASLETAMRAMLGIGPKVHLVLPKTIARSEGKAVRVIDKRKLHD